MLSLMSACDNGMGHCLLSIETQIISIRSLQSSSEGLYFFYSCTMTHPPSSQIATIAPRCLLHLNFPGFYLAMKREAWLLWTWFYIALVNKLVSLTWFLWVLRSFQRFTLHFFNTYHNRFQIDEVADVFTRTNEKRSCSKPCLCSRIWSHTCSTCHKISVAEWGNVVNLQDVKVLFMQSDGGLTPMNKWVGISIWSLRV